jgi:hypothetical protein
LSARPAPAAAGFQASASLLLLPLVGFLPADDPRIMGTVGAIEKFLLRDCFVARYDTESQVDGLPGDEGAFLACSFWLADNYILQGRYEHARAMFERLLSLRNDVGLLAEEYDPRARRQVGNFPQAFSHVALINTAHNRAQPDAGLRTGPASGGEQGDSRLRGHVIRPLISFQMGLWAKAGISPPSELAWETGEAEPVGKADRHSRSTKILSMQRPLPSMLIVTPPRSRTPVKSVLVNWLPDPC